MINFRSKIDEVKRKVKHIYGKEGKDIQKIRTGYIGCGDHSFTNIYPALRYAPINLIACAARHKDKAESFARQFGGDRGYDDYIQMLDSEKLDAVIVVVGPDLHYKAAKEALIRGINVFVEKPATSTLEEAMDLQNLKKEKEKVLMVGFCKRFAPCYQEANKIIASKEFGTPTSIQTKFSVGHRWGSERNFLLHIAIHHFDLLNYLLGDVEIIDFQKDIRENQYSYAVLVRFKSGAVGTMNLSTQGSYKNFSERVEVTGEENFVVVDNLVNLKYYRKTDAVGGSIPDDSQKTLSWEPNFSVPDLESQGIYLGGYVGELRHFADCVLNKKMPESSIEDHIKALKLIDKL